MSSSVLVWLQRLLPQRLLGKFIYWISRTERAWIKSTLIEWFARHYDVDLDEAEHSTLSSYASFNAFFTRGLRAGARSIDGARGTIVSPVDGELTQFGVVSEGRLLQAKGFDYRLAELIGESPDTLIDGAYATVYLGPRDYHRVHAPYAGKLCRIRYLAGKRFSVNAATAGRIQNLFCRNERLVCWFEGTVGTYAIVLIGALNVASFSTAALGEISSGADRSWTELGAPSYERGEMFATFNLGSTVVLVFPRGSIEWRDDLRSGQRLRLGARIGTALETARQ
jgi:phosphatidylserine decarboxylase